MRTLLLLFAIIVFGLKGQCQIGYEKRSSTKTGNILYVMVQDRKGITAPNSLVDNSNENKSRILRIRHSIFSGIPIGGIFDSPNIGIHLGYSITISPLQLLALEGQVFYTYGKYSRDADTFAQDGGFISTLNAVGGVRLYFAKENKKYRPYLNILLGKGYITDQEYINNVVRTRKTDDIGYNIGFFVTTPKGLNFGLAMETWMTAVIKVGYTFW